MLNEQLKLLCIHGSRHNTCGNCIRKTNEKMKRKVTKLNSNCDNFMDPVDFMDNIGMF
jgi:hypothetical protein